MRVNVDSSVTIHVLYTLTEREEKSLGGGEKNGEGENPVVEFRGFNGKGMGNKHQNIYWLSPCVCIYYDGNGVGYGL